MNRFNSRNEFLLREKLRAFYFDKELFIHFENVLKRNKFSLPIALAVARKKCVFNSRRQGMGHLQANYDKIS